MHIHHTLFAAVARREEAPELLEELLHEHLAALCEVCAREILEGEARQRRPGISRHVEPRDPLERLRRRLGLREAELQKHTKPARRWVRKVLKLAPAERGETVGNAYSNYRGPIFCFLLLEEARRRIPRHPAEALSLAEAVLTANRKAGGGYHPDPDTHAPALAVRGNAKRALGRIRAAEADLEEAEELLDSPGVTEFATAGEVHAYLGSLRKDQGRLEEAIHHLDRAAVVFRLLRDQEKAAQVLLRLGLVQYGQHNPAAAVASTESALALLDEGSAPWLRAYARYNLAFHLHAAGETARAEAELAAHEDLLAAAGDEVVQHVAWLRGRIAWSRGDLPVAARLLTEARKGARERGIPWDAGLVGLELALVELAQGRTTRAKKLASEALEIFAEQEVERETRAALEVLEAASRRDNLTREVVEGAVAALEARRHRGPARRPDRL